MFITKRKHEQIIEHKDKSINDAQKRVLDLEKELRQAKDLKAILEDINNRNSVVTTGEGLTITEGLAGTSVTLDDSVAVYVKDMLGGKKVIKQEAVRCYKLSEDGSVEKGYTKKKADKGYNYKLIRG